MATARELEIERIKSRYMPGYGASGAPGASIAHIAKAAELQRIKQEAERTRQRVAQTTQESAEQQAKAMIAASRGQAAAATTMEGRHTTNLAETQARTQKATDTAVGLLNPWREAGTDALGKLQKKIDDGPGDMKKSPGYKFRLAEGQKAIERGAAARGGALSGSALKAGMKYGQEFATNDYDNFLRRYYDSMAPLERLSGQGMAASTQMGNTMMQGARDMAQQGFTGTSAINEATRYGADSTASGSISAANIIAQQQREAAERDYGYAAFKAGEDF